jgi:hypothetical protein
MPECLLVAMPSNTCRPWLAWPQIREITVSAALPLPLRFKVAIAYFVLAVGLGVGMGATHNFTLMPVHAHMNLVGWVSQALIAFIFRLYPGIEETGLAKAQFWIYNIFGAILLVMLTIYLLGHPAIEPLLAIASIGTFVGVVLVPITLWRWQPAA